MDTTKFNATKKFTASTPHWPSARPYNNNTEDDVISEKAGNVEKSHRNSTAFYGVANSSKQGFQGSKNS